MFAFTPGRRQRHAVVLFIGLFLGSCGRPARTYTSAPTGPTVPLPIVGVLPPKLLLLMTRADGSAIAPDQELVRAEAAQIYNTAQVWLMRHAKPGQVRLLTEPVSIPANDAAGFARTLAQQQQVQTVLLTHVYHHRIYAPTTVMMPPSTVVAQATGEGQATAVPAALPPPAPFSEELSIDMTLYRADGTVAWKYTRRGQPDRTMPTAGYLADRLMKDGLAQMPFPTL